MIHRGFVRDTGHVVCRLHDRDRVVERLQIALQGTGTALVEPRTEPIDVICRQGVTDLVSKLEHRLGAQPAVEMVVEDRLRKRLDIGHDAMRGFVAYFTVNDA